ncbi:putative tetratricopeptide repeat protein 13-like [Forsythia ovata]|uniref:Tetratricopeptide repeat protein 13-like n=1 Tax=Forsythia ovata TaxID=205694 RepID=A0ABD1U717_9LAMI
MRESRKSNQETFGEEKIYFPIDFHQVNVRIQRIQSQEEHCLKIFTKRIKDFQIFTKNAFRFMKDLKDLLHFSYWRLNFHQTWIPYKGQSSNARLSEKDKNIYTIKAVSFSDIRSIRRHTPTLGHTDHPIKIGENGFDFGIRTPCTPSRWEDFEVEMTSAWEALCDAYCGNYGSTDFDVLENVRGEILRMTYY